MKFGSHLYETNTENSDTDYKGICLPSFRDLILQNVPKSINSITKKTSNAKNTPDDIDHEIYSIHYFLKLALKGETVAIDMLHAPEGWECTTSTAWESLKAEKEHFYTKNLRAYMGYVRVQAAKYGIKGSRLNAAETFNNFLKKHLDRNMKLIELFDDIEETEFVCKRIIAEASQDDKRAIVVLDKIFMVTTPIKYIIECLDKFIEDFGHRARLAKENKGVDFKAISHAFRAAYQLEEIYTTGNLVFPLKQAEFLLGIKEGKYHYANELASLLEYMVERIYKLAAESHYPEEADVSF